MTQQRDVEPMAALVGTAVALSVAARHAGGGVRTAGRRAARGGTNLGRRAWANALDSRERATVAYRVYRGDGIVYERRPGEYVAAGVIAGVMAAFAAVALGRALSRGPDGGPGATGATQRRLDAARSTAMRITRRRPAPETALADELVDAPGNATTSPVSA